MLLASVLGTPSSVKPQHHFDFRATQMVYLATLRDSLAWARKKRELGPDGFAQFLRAFHREQILPSKQATVLYLAALEDQLLNCDPQLVPDYIHFTTGTFLQN